MQPGQFHHGLGSVSKVSAHGWSRCQDNVSMPPDLLKSFDFSLPEPQEKILQGNASRVAFMSYVHHTLQIMICESDLFKHQLTWDPKRQGWITAGCLSRAGAETPLNFLEKFRVFPRMILENFSGVDTQTAVLVSTAEVWISAPDTQTPIFLGFLGIHS